MELSGVMNTLIPAFLQVGGVSFDLRVRLARPGVGLLRSARATAPFYDTKHDLWS
jgi:hypothetical protein